jgi:hypothetical protein
MKHFLKGQCHEFFFNVFFTYNNLLWPQETRLKMDRGSLCLTYDLRFMLENVFTEKYSN